MGYSPEVIDLMNKISELEAENITLKAQVKIWQKRYYSVIRGDNGE